MNVCTLSHGPAPHQDMLDLAHARYSDLPPGKRLCARALVGGLELTFRLLSGAAMLSVPVALYAGMPATLPVVALVSWGACEAMFLVWNMYWVYGLEKRRPMPLISPSERMALAVRVREHMLGDDDSLAGWYAAVRTSQTSPVNRWLAWAFFDAEEVLPEDEAVLAMFTGGKLLGQDAITIGAMHRPTLDPLVYKTKPLLFYGLLRMYQHTLNAKLLLLGLRRYPAGCIHYWKTNRNTKAADPPIVLIHGVGFGPGVYVNHVHKLLELYPDRQIYVLELPCIVVGSFAAIPTMAEILASIDTLFLENGLARCSFVGHSYGTVVCTWLAYHRPQYLDRLTLVDPVCFDMFQSQFLQKCVYQAPSCFEHDLALYLIFRDPLLGAVFMRNFWWHQNNLFPEDIPVPTTVFLAELDWIIDAPTVFNYLQARLSKAPNPTVHVHMLNLAHGEYVFNPEVLELICQRV